MPIIEHDPKEVTNCTVRKSTERMSKAQQKRGAHVKSNFKNRGMGVIVGSMDFPNDEGYVLIVSQMTRKDGSIPTEKETYTTHSQLLEPCEIPEELVKYEWL